MYLKLQLGKVPTHYSLILGMSLSLGMRKSACLYVSDALSLALPLGSHASLYLRGQYKHYICILWTPTLLPKEEISENQLIFMCSCLWRSKCGRRIRMTPL